jgi:hypothetical protein
MLLNQPFEFHTLSTLDILSARLRTLDRAFNVIPINAEWLQFSISKQTWLKFEVEVYGELWQLDADTVRIAGVSRITAATYLELGVYTSMILVGAVMASSFLRLQATDLGPSVFLAWPMCLWIIAVVVSMVHILYVKDHLTSRIVKTLRNGD